MTSSLQRERNVAAATACSGSGFCIDNGGI
jgi:hypothetical protein